MKIPRAWLGFLLISGPVVLGCSGSSSSGGSGGAGGNAGASGSAGAGGAQCSDTPPTAGCMLGGLNECDDYFDSPASDVQTSCQTSSGTFLPGGCDPTNNLGHCLVTSGHCEVIWSYPPASAADEQQSCANFWQGTWTTN